MSPWLIVGIVLGGAAAVTAVGLGALALVAGLALRTSTIPTKFDNAQVDQGVTEVLRDQYGSPDVKDVVCRTEGVEVKAGNTFTCDAVIGGQQKTVAVTVLDDTGRYQVAQPR